MKAKSSLLKVERFRRILDIVAAKQRVSLSELESFLDVSRITIQRDLVELENRGQLKRFHGGAMSLDYSESLYDHRVRKTINVAAKRKIACKAAKLIKRGIYVGMDSSTTVYYLSEQILPHDVLVLSCGIDSFSSLSSNSSLTVMLSGGRLKRKTNTLVGPEAVEMIKRFSFDLVFVSAETYVPGKGFFNPCEDEVAVKKALIESSSKTAMLIDVSKIGNTGGIKVCSSKEIDYFITDNPSHKIIKKFLGKKAM